MGFKVESYTLSELNRIALPGSVAPSLFWGLPVGAWHPSEVANLWHLFTTESSSKCFLHGLLLVRDAFRSEAQPHESQVNLASVGARLRDLMPRGVNQFVRPSALQDDARRLLVLSGAYPQPGWGVLIECSTDP